MMKFGKLLSIATVAFATLSIVESSEVCLEFGRNDNTTMCGNEVRSFTNLSDFSSELNNGIAGNLFKSTLVEKNGDVITFNGIRSNESSLYNLMLSGVNGFTPKVVFNCNSGKVYLNKLICNNIMCFDIYSTSHCLLRNIHANNSKIVLHDNCEIFGRDFVTTSNGGVIGMSSRSH